ncbi:PorT family protein [Subsaxibacter sp. CAU 1640]|uniref:porin family protein n=1 Tax=Subsaxibacter sp. CAU 1640 TaxID=2933271 RepID=UPI0020041986|nr:porin family protein [Subsaxibacter sp. CAU 1640]MCK7591444.1 PorT family protein [Subsaxibacter sp. CAU 1640]
MTAVTVMASQLGSAQNVTWGVKAGANLSNLNTDLDSEKYLLGFHVGGLAEIPLGAKFSIQPELLYSLEGAKLEDEFSFEDEGITYGLDFKEEVKLSYLQLPVMFKYRMTDKFSFEAGPQVGYLLNAKSEYDSTLRVGGDTFSDSGSEKIKDQVKSIAFGVNFGLGYQFTNNMFIQGRYHLGLSDLDDTDSNLEEDDVDRGSVKNRSFQVSIGYRF